MATLNSSEAQIDTPLIRTHTFLFIYFYFWLRWVLAAAHGLPLVVESRDYSPKVHGLLTAVAFSVVEHGFSS